MIALFWGALMCASTSARTKKSAMTRRVVLGFAGG